MDTHSRYVELVRSKMRALMGAAPSGMDAVGRETGPGRGFRRPPEIEVKSVEKSGSIEQRRIVYRAENDDWVPAVLLIPAGKGKRAPGVVCLHQTTSIGKEEPAGLGGKSDLHYARELSEAGFVTISPDYPGFGEYECDPYRLGYESTTMKGIYNHGRAIDLLQSSQFVDPVNIGCIGHSLGGHNTLFLAAYDTRVRVAVTSCGFTSFAKYKGGEITPWAQAKYMPWVKPRYGADPDRMPFDFSDLLSAIAPRSVFVSAPLGDDNFDSDGVQDSLRAAEPVFTRLGAGERLSADYPETGHEFPIYARRKAYSYMAEVLRAY